MERLRSLPGTSKVTTAGERVTAIGDDSDALATLLLTELGGTNLEVTTASLDAAFLAITGDEIPAEDEAEETR